MFKMKAMPCFLRPKQQLAGVISVCKLMACALAREVIQKRGQTHLLKGWYTQKSSFTLFYPPT